jgi:hypothetical protein
MKVLGLIHKTPKKRSYHCITVFSAGIVVCIDDPVVIATLYKDNQEKEWQTQEQFPAIASPCSWLFHKISLVVKDRNKHSFEKFGDS